MQCKFSDVDAEINKIKSTPKTNPQAQSQMDVCIINPFVAAIHIWHIGNLINQKCGYKSVVLVELSVLYGFERTQKK